MKPKFSISFLSANLLDLKNELLSLPEKNPPWLHFDIMDGHFVPNLSYGPWLTQKIIEFMHKHSQVRFFDAHLMVSQPQDWIDEFLNAKISLLTFHWEAYAHPHRLIQKIKPRAQVGIALNPVTPFDAVKEVLVDLDLLLIMTVNPGFGGQAFIPQTIHKIQQAHAWREQKGLHYQIQVDGGINSHWIQTLQKEVDCFVIGSSFFNLDPQQRKLWLESIEHS